jgi:hypothetical protein
MTKDEAQRRRWTSCEAVKEVIQRLLAIERKKRDGNLGNADLAATLSIGARTMRSLLCVPKGCISVSVSR